MRISDWSSDVCSSDLAEVLDRLEVQQAVDRLGVGVVVGIVHPLADLDAPLRHLEGEHHVGGDGDEGDDGKAPVEHHPEDAAGQRDLDERSEEHTSELQSLMRISYAVFCLTKKT